MNTLQKFSASLILILTVFIFAGDAHGGDINFEFKIPTIPDTPVITSVIHDTPVEGDTTFTVYATIEGQVQMEACCNGVCVHECEPNCNFSGCGLADFYAEPDPRVLPNPTCIPGSTDTSGGVNPAACTKPGGNPKVFYYTNGDATQNGNVSMTYNSGSDRFEADIPLNGLINNDFITYYIAASDNRGNVVSQVPDIQTVPCTTISSWDKNYETPALDNCSAMNSYERCGLFVSGKPACGSLYSLNDPADDSCDSTGSVNESKNIVDILGISAGAGKGFQGLPGVDVVCSNIKLAAPPPDMGSSSGEIDGYLMIFFNPDIIDPNPGDTHMENAFSITYVPEISSTEANLVKVLWDGGCVTDPNTADPLSCKITIGGSGVEELKVGASNTELRFIAKNALANGKTILGSGSAATRVIVATGGIDLNGDIPFWLVDMTAGLNLVKENKTAIVAGGVVPLPAPDAQNPALCKRSDGTEFSDGICMKADIASTGNTCSILVKPSKKADKASEYRIYHSLTNNAQDARNSAPIHTITSNLSGNNTYTYTVDQAGLKGETHYFFFTTVNKNSPYPETESGNESASRCKVEDQYPPVEPGGFQCATPDGNEKKCKCQWSFDTSADSSISGFEISRDSAVIVESQVAVNGTNYYTDISADLVLGQEYTYSVTAIDVGGNRSGDVTTTCTPEDLKDPSDVGAVILTEDFLSAAKDVIVAWMPVNDDSMAGGGYNVFRCHAALTPEISCSDITNYVMVNTSEIAHPESSTILTHVDAGPYQDDQEYCYWVQSCDACDDAGTCDSNGGEPNCSNFSGYQQCEMFPMPPPAVERPKFPENFVAEPAPEGGKCSLTWNRVCDSVAENGSIIPFEDCDSPTPLELTGYAVMRGEASGSSCSTGDVSYNPETGTPVSIMPVSATPEYSDTGLSNGTTYCYVIIGNDMMGHFSKSDPLPAPVKCKPADTLAPAKPVMISVDDNQQIMADIVWTAVEDKDPVVYNIHECAKAINECAAGDFSEVKSGLNDLNFSQFYDGSKVYTYCVTAVDPSGNESAVFEGDLENCDDTAAVVPPPTAAEASAFAGGVKVWWTNSAGDEGTYSATTGYNVYLCKDAYAKKDLSSCEGGGPVNDSPEKGTHDLLLDTIPYEFATETFDDGDYFVGVTYILDARESEPEYIETAITLRNIATPPPSVCETVPSSCVVITISGVPGLGGIVSCTDADPECLTGAYKKDVIPAEGIIVRVVSASGAVVKQVTLKSFEDQAKIYIENSGISAQETYRVLQLVPDDIAPAAFDAWCLVGEADSEGYCVIELRKAQSLNAGSGFTVKPELLPSSAGGGGGAEIGNVNGDGAVNLFDIGPITPAFGVSKGGTCYRAWADLNMDGTVNLFDLTVLKENFGKVIDSGAAGFDPALSSKKSPLPDCCKAGTCK